MNLAIILTGVKLTAGISGGRKVFTGLLCRYFLVVTAVLPVSSFYRMLLYTEKMAEI